MTKKSDMGMLPAKICSICGATSPTDPCNTCWIKYDKPFSFEAIQKAKAKHNKFGLSSTYWIKDTSETKEGYQDSFCKKVGFNDWNSIFKSIKSNVDVRTVTGPYMSYNLIKGGYKQKGEWSVKNALYQSEIKAYLKRKDIKESDIKIIIEKLIELKFIKVFDPPDGGILSEDEIYKVIK